MKKILTILILLGLSSYTFTYSFDNDVNEEYTLEDARAYLSSSQELHVQNPLEKTNISNDFDSAIKTEQQSEQSMTLEAFRKNRKLEEQELWYKDLKQQALNEAVDQTASLIITGIFLILLSSFIILLGWIYEKITKKQIKKERTKEGTVVSNRIKRFINFCIDFVLILSTINNVLIYFAIVNEWLFIISNQFIIWIVVISFYYIFCESLLGRTVGKFFTRTKVISDSGGKASFGQIIVRTLVRFIPFEAFSFMGKWPNGWHDKWSGTIVVKSSYEKLDKTDNRKTNKVRLQNNVQQNIERMKYCKKCGKKILKESKFCNKCGSEL